MTTEKTGPGKRKRVSAAANWLAGLAVPLAVLLVCFAVDMTASERLTSDLGRSALLTLLAATLQILVILSVVPWWSAGLLEHHSFGTLIAALRVLTQTVSVTVLLLLLAFLQDRSAFADVFRAQTVVLCVGLLVAALAGLAQVALRRVKPAALVTTFLGFFLFASRFWGNVPVRWAGEAWRAWAVGFVAGVTPLSACASAVGYDLFRGRMLYVRSVVSDYPHRLPEWWVYALVTGLAGVALMELAALIRRRSRRS